MVLTMTMEVGGDGDGVLMCVCMCVQVVPTNDESYHFFCESCVVQCPVLNSAFTNGTAGREGSQTITKQHQQYAKLKDSCNLHTITITITITTPAFLQFAQKEVCLFWKSGFVM